MLDRRRAFADNPRMKPNLALTEQISAKRFATPEFPEIRVSQNHGNQESRVQDRAKTTTRRNSSEWSVLEKPVAPLPSPPPAGNSFLPCRSLELAKGFEPLTL
jgi:hypothetical protein